jgi:quercetin dioxygenase-like cupin family protein
MKEIDRRPKHAHALGSIAASAVFAGLLSAATAAEPSHEAMGMEGQVVLKATRTAADQPLQLPQSDTPEITSMLVTIQPGGHSNLHSHPVPIFAYVLEGSLDVHDGEMVRSYKPGEGVMEPMNRMIQAFNPGSVPTKLLVVMIGVEGKPNSIAAE